MKKIKVVIKVERNIEDGRRGYKIIEIIPSEKVYVINSSIDENGRITIYPPHRKPGLSGRWVQAGTILPDQEFNDLLEEIQQVISSYKELKEWQNEECTETYTLIA